MNQAFPVNSEAKVNTIIENGWNFLSTLVPLSGTLYQKDIECSSEMCFIETTTTIQQIKRKLDVVQGI